MPAFEQRLEQTFARQDESMFATALSNNTVRLWDTATGTPIQTLTGHQDEVLNVVFSPDGRTIATAGWDRTIRLWDSESGRLVSTMSTFGTDGSRVTAASFDDSAVTAYVGVRMGRAQQIHRKRNKSELLPDCPNT